MPKLTTDNDKKIIQISVRITPTDYNKIQEIIAELQTNTNLTYTTSEIVQVAIGKLHNTLVKKCA